MATSLHHPELLSPAGSLKNMRYAFAYGADAVYAGQPRYSLRVRNNEFDHAHLALGIAEAHAQGKQFYVVVNLAPHNAKLKTCLKDLAPVIEMGPDALIMSDPGLIMLVCEHFPQMPIHLSVQANAVNWASVKFWQQQGLSRVILSRELSLEEIGEIRNEVPGMQLEVFVHGALCMAYSGRCLLSGYINKRDPNQGSCTNACRWQYQAETGRENKLGDIVRLVAPTLGAGAPTDQLFLLEDASRPGEQMAAFEDEHGTYIMNSKDLRAVQHVERLVRIGVHSLKIEGRTKSHYYVARTAQVYRQAIDDAVAGRPFDQSLMGTLESLAHRGYTEGFLRRHVHDEYQNYERGSSLSEQQQFVGELTGERRDELAEVRVKNRFALGDGLELMTPQGNLRFRLDHLENRQGQAMAVAPGDGHVVYLALPAEVALGYGTKTCRGVTANARVGGGASRRVDDASSIHQIATVDEKGVIHPTRLSIAAGLLLVISTSISHDLLKSNLMPNVSEKKELLAARLAAGVAVLVAGLFGIYPPAFVAQVVAFAFGLAAASFFPAIVMGIFSKKMNKEGAIAGMVVGLAFTFSYIVYYKFIFPTAGPADWWFGISPEGIGTQGMIFNFVVAIAVAQVTAAPPEHIQHIIEDIRIPRGAGAAIEH